MRLSRVLAAGLFLVLTPFALWATTWNVAQTGCSNTTCTPCCNIQAAVERSSGGDAISVGPGTYVEQVDIRDMLSVGDITLLAAGGPGTVLVSPASGRALTHAGFDVNTVTVEGVDFTSPDMTCVFLAHSGDVVLIDVTASGCGNHGFEIDATGSVSLERCNGDGNGNKGIQIDGAAGVTLTDCGAELNTSAGIYVLNATGPVNLVNPSGVTNSEYGIEVDATGAVSLVAPISTGNTQYGVGFAVTGSVTITGGTIADNGDQGVWPWVDGTFEIDGATVTGNAGRGIDLEGLGGTPASGVTLTSTTVDNNGHGTGDPGVRLRDVTGPVTVSNCTFDNNGYDGLSVEVSVVGDLEITGGHANGNADDGFDLRNVGDLTITGASAAGNTTKGFGIDNQAVVRLEDCTADGNLSDGGFIIDWQDPETIDGVTITGCTSTSNGLALGGNGMLVRHVAGPVTVTGSQFNGNAGEGLTIADAAGIVLVRDVTSTFNGGSGIETRLDGGPLTIADCISSDNNIAGLDVYSPGILIAEARIHRNIIADNVAEGVMLVDLGGAGPFEATCNDITGNDTGMYLDSPLTVDARWVWWGDPTGPSGQGPGTGDGIYAEPGGTIQHSPWLAESFTAPVSGCPIFTADHESGTLAEWDAIAN